MLPGFSECFDPFVIAERGRTYRGVIALGELDRLAGCVFSDHGEVGYELTFSKEGSVFVVSGQVKADLILECQVCLEALVLPVSTDTRLGIVGCLRTVAGARQKNRIEGDSRGRTVAGDSHYRPSRRMQNSRWLST